jgi:hypothetical protein
MIEELLEIIREAIERIQEETIKFLGELFCSSATDKQSCMWGWYNIYYPVVLTLVFLFVLLCLILIAYRVEDYIDRRMWWRSW